LNFLSSCSSTARQ